MNISMADNVNKLSVIIEYLCADIKPEKLELMDKLLQDHYVQCSGY